MPCRFLQALLIFAVVASATAVFAQEDFSAQMVNTQTGKEAKIEAKIYVTKDKMRIEPQNQTPGRGGVVIINFGSQTSDVLVPEQKLYMEFGLGQGPNGQRLGMFFRPAQIDDACGDWQKLASNRDGTCKKIGSETVNGRKTVKYEGSFANGNTSYVWLDTDIVFPIKWEGKNSSGELRNISEGSQAASLFTVPSDYQKMQMPAGMPGMPRQ